MMVTTVNKRPYLFDNLREFRKELAEEIEEYGLEVYDVRDDDDCSGTFANIKRSVLVNYWGTIIGKEALPLDQFGTYWCKDEDGQFIDADPESVEDYLKHYDELLEMCH